jgi:hypothetical protein
MTADRAVLAGAVLVAACGSSVTAAPAPTASPDAGLTTADVAPAFCPAAGGAVENGPCLRPSVVCEYGSSPDPACNTLYACTTDPAYGMYWTEQQHGRCPKCPAAIADGAPCDSADELACATAAGTCACTVGPDGAHAHPRRWVCVPTTAGCPSARPLLGQPCALGADVRCDYGACAFARGTSMRCDRGVWILEEAPCP